MAERRQQRPTAPERPALGGRRQRDAEQLPAVRLTAGTTVKDSALTASCDPGRGPRPDAGRRDLRRLRRQHDPADLPALPPGTADDAPAPAPDGADDRRPPERQGRRLGLVLGRLVERRRATSTRRGGRTARTGRRAPDPAAFATATCPNCPDKLFQFHHQPLNYFASFAPGTRRARCAPARRGRVRGAGPELEEALRAQAREPHQAHRRRERAPRLHQRQRGQRPPGRAAERDPEQPLRQGHDGRRDLRRVRRPVGSRVAAGPGRDARRARQHGPEHAHPGARARARPARRLRRRPRRSTTRRRSWRRSSTASACRR